MIDQSMSEKVFFESEGEKVCGVFEIVSEKKEIVLLVHGHGSNKNGQSILSLAHELKERGVNSFRIDLRGNGESEGKFENQTLSTWAEDTRQAIRFLRGKSFTTIDLFGNSAGGTVSLIVAASEDIRLLGLKAPPSDYPQQIRDRYSDESFEAWKKAGKAFYKVRNGKNLYEGFGFYEDAQSYDIYSMAETIMAKTLLVHGNVDTVVKVEQSNELAKHLRHAEYVIIKGADHDLAVDGDISEYLALFGQFFEHA